MSTHESNQIVDTALRGCFRAGIAFRQNGDRSDADDLAVFVASLAPGTDDPPGLRHDRLPYLAVPEDRPASVAGEGRLILVAVEGRDRRMATALSELLDPGAVVIGLMHVTWMPRTIASPLSAEGLNNPESGDLLLYRGAREALIDTANGLRSSGFDVSTHLREDRDPARPLAETVERQRPDLFILGLGRHGAGIGHRVLAETRIPVLFVKAR